MTLWAALGWLMIIAPTIGMIAGMVISCGWRETATFFCIVLAALTSAFWIVLARMLIFGEVP